MSNTYADRARQESFRWAHSPELPTYVTIEQFCERAQLAESTVRQWIAAGRIRAVQAGGDGGIIRIPVGELSRVFSPVATKSWAAKTPAETVAAQED